MENPRPEKVAVVDEVRAKFQASEAVLLTEYRGLKVAELGALRAAMRDAGGEYRIYKNTLVRRAAQSLDLDLDAVLTGPTALAFVMAKADGSPGDISTVAKAVTTFANTNPLLVLKGGILGDVILDARGAKALASLPTASEIYSRLAGALNSSARSLAGVVNGVPRAIAYVLQAAIDAGAFAGDPPVIADPTPEAAAPVAEAAVEAEAAEDDSSAVTETAVTEATEPEATEPEINESTEEN